MVQNCIPILNDAKSASLAEFHFGLAKEKENVLVISMDWGVGLGIIMGGKIQTGVSGFAGEFGHIPMVEDGTLCHCGKRGCLETEASGLALVRKVKEGLEQGQTSVLNTLSDEALEKLEPDTIVENVEKKIVTEGREIKTQLKNFPWDPWVVGLVSVNFLLGVEIGAARTFTTSYVFLRSSEMVSFANTVFFVMLVGAGVATIGIGPLADMFDKRNLGALTFLITGFLLLLTWVVPPNRVLLLGLFFLIGAMMWTTVPVMNALTSTYAKRDFSGMLFALTLTGSALGNSVGPFMFGLILERTDITVAYPAIAVSSLAGAIAFLVMKRF